MVGNTLLTDIIQQLYQTEKFQTLGEYGSIKRFQALPESGKHYLENSELFTANNLFKLYTKNIDFKDIQSRMERRFFAKRQAYLRVSFKKNDDQSPLLKIQIRTLTGFYNETAKIMVKEKYLGTSFHVGQDTSWKLNEDDFGITHDMRKLQNHLESLDLLEVFEKCCNFK